MRRVVFLFPSHRKWFAGKERTNSFCNFLIGTNYKMILTQVDVCFSLCYWDASTLPRSRGKWPFLKQLVDLECVVAKIKTRRREMECQWSRCWSILWYSVQLNIIMLELSTERSNVEGWTRVGARLSRVLSVADKTIQPPCVFCTVEKEFNAKFHIVVRKDDDTETLVVVCPMSSHSSVRRFISQASHYIIVRFIVAGISLPLQYIVVSWSPEGNWQWSWKDLCEYLRAFYCERLYYLIRCFGRNTSKQAKKVFHEL